MIGNRTRTWWQHFSAAGVLFALASCSSEAIAPPEPFDDDEPGALAGELTVYIANYDDGTADTRYFLKVSEGDERRLHFSAEPDVAPGTRIKLWGTQRGDKLAVAKYKIMAEGAAEGIGSSAQALKPSEIVDAAAKPGRVMCAALVNINSGTAKTSLDAVKNSFHTGSGSVNNYYRENSFGQVGLSGDTFGPYSYPSFGSSCNYSGLASTVKPMIKTDASGKGITCEQFAFVFGPGGGCGWSGLGQVGTSDKPATDTWYADSVSCVVAVQEPGHNYGMQHSSSLSCGSAPFADSLSSCTHNEYGDKYDTMGGGCYHMNAWQKLYQKWFGGCNGVRTTSSGKFTIFPIEAPCNGVQVLQLPFPGGKTRSFQSTTLTSYYLELRTNIGFDSKITTPQVFIHAGGAPILPNQSNPKGLHTWIITVGSPGLTAGKSFSDPAGGLTITVDSVSAQSAVVDVNYAAGSGEAVCLDGSNTPFVPPGPSDCTAPPTPGDASTPPPPTDARVDTGTGGAGMDVRTDVGTSGTGGSGTDAAGGTAGKAGSGGTGGAGGTGGSTGGTGGTTGGTGGSGGDTGGTGGTTGGKGGGATGGSGGDGGRGAAGSRPTPEPLSGGCGCKVASSEGAAGARTSLVLLGLAGLFGARRRKRNPRV